MIQLTDDEVVAALTYPALIECLREVFCSDYHMPVRHHHFYQTDEGVENTLILMPAWNTAYLGIKQVVVAPSNREKGLPTIHARYTLLDARTGVVLAQMDAGQLTAYRTACASALAAAYLTRSDVSSLLIVGGGKVARHLAQAHAAVRSYRRIAIWTRDPAKANGFADELRTAGYPAEPVTDLKAAVRSADVISCATLAPDPIIQGAWLKPGAHLDLIGSHTPRTREADDEAIRRSQVFVDSREGALHETGDLAIPIATGVFHPEAVVADLAELCRGQHPGRTTTEAITLFKSAGLAIEDLAAALLVYRSFLP